MLSHLRLIFKNHTLIVEKIIFTRIRNFRNQKMLEHQS